MRTDETTCASLHGGGTLTQRCIATTLHRFGTSTQGYPDNSDRGYFLEAFWVVIRLLTHWLAMERLRDFCWTIL